MKNFFRYLLDIRVISVLGLAALAAFLFLGAGALQIALIWAVLALALAGVVWLVVWVVRKLLARRAARKLEGALEADADNAQKAAPTKDRAELEAVRERMKAAVKTIRSSKLGEMTGSAALYELPWYMIIGNPAAGKSTAVVKSGLKFPFADASGNIIQGIGGTRNCDWFFTSEGILLDTAGRYSVHDEDRAEWLGFLNLLKKNRPKAPINGILIAASVAELSQARPDSAIQLAKNLRQRVQELTEKLEVFAPVYLVFTKTDLVSGFVEFFEDRDRDEREKVWGATLPYDPAVKADAVEQFDRHFDELRDGLKEVALARMTLQRGQALPPGVLTFPLEFAALKPALRSFVATLFEDNPYQFRPIFRGFYFTSAVQEGSASSRASEQVAQQFALNSRTEHTTARVSAEHGFFLRELFSRVVFADRNLVRQYTSRYKQRARALTFAVAVGALALALGLWSWAYVGNRALMANVQADLDKAVKLQSERVDLASRLEALEVLQDRIEQLSAWRDSRPMSVSLGLYQGDAIERKLRDEYFNGMRQVMVQPVAQAIEGYLGEVNNNAGALQPMTKPPGSSVAPLAAATTPAAPAAAASAAAAASTRPVASRFVEASATNVEEAYNALKTYLMLAERPRMESAHLTDQITRFWRRWLDDNRGAMPRDQMIRSAERMISFAMANLQDPAFPVLNSNLGLVDQTRENLKRVVRGMPARERIYAEIKARASTRFAPVTVARILEDDTKAQAAAATGKAAGSVGLGAAVASIKPSIAGSYTVSGTFTKEAWEEYIEDAFKEASTNELQTADWVLRVSSRDDLSLEGSPDQIRKVLTEMYKTEYVTEWKRFIEGISVVEFANFDDAAMHLNRLGNAETSPIRRVLVKLFDQTSWDNPSALNDKLAKGQASAFNWIKQAILRQGPSQVEMKVDVTGNPLAVPMGPVGREFNGVSGIVMSTGGNPARINEYLKLLGAVRTRFNEIKNAGDTGPPARKLMTATLEGNESELSKALRFVDEQMMSDRSSTGRNTNLRPLLVRPLIQAFSVLVPPTEVEINRQWAAQVLEPYARTLAAKYPFDVNSKVEAGAQEISKVFGPEGGIAKFANDGLGNLVVRRGDAITPRTWADVGVRLQSRFVTGFARWVLPLEGAAGGGGGGGGGSSGGGAGGGATAASASQTAFQILPQGAPGLTEYTVEIDGQVLRYRNTAPVWTDMLWPVVTGQPGARITGVTLDGRTVEVLSAPGRFGLEKMFELAQRKRLPDGASELTWTSGGQSVTVHLRVISAPGATASAETNRAGGSASTPPSPTNTGLRGLVLPDVIAGAEGPVTPGGARNGAASPTVNKAPK
jgi:type VI secretion system protein ImpL